MGFKFTILCARQALQPMKIVAARPPIPKPRVFSRHASLPCHYLPKMDLRQIIGGRARRVSTHGKDTCLVQAPLQCQLLGSIMLVICSLCTYRTVPYRTVPYPGIQFVTQSRLCSCHCYAVLIIFRVVVNGQRK
jgi:hypothetical protein